MKKSSKPFENVSMVDVQLQVGEQFHQVLNHSHLIHDLEVFDYWIEPTIIQLWRRR